jgi:cytidine deaminase
MSRTLSFADLGARDRRLVEAARAVAVHAYAPYSRFAVGAAVRTKRGRIHKGANLESASYGLSLCAEVAALAAANSSGDYAIEAIAVAAKDGTEPVTPCGRCRQLLFEAAHAAGTDIRVLCCSGKRDRIVETTIAELLPSAFRLSGAAAKRRPRAAR